MKFTSAEVGAGTAEPKIKEMPYENKANENVSEPDKRGLELNLGEEDTAFKESVKKFRKLTSFDSTDGFLKSGVREVKKVNIDLSRVKPLKKSSKLKKAIILILLLSLIGAAYFILEDRGVF